MADGCALDRASPPMRLWQKAARHVWTVDALDLHEDRGPWLVLSDEARDRIRGVCALFQLGERAVTRHLLPLVRVVAAERRLEEEIFLTSFLWDEAKHVDLFDRFFSEIDAGARDPRQYVYPGFQRIVDQELASALGRLWDDTSPAAQVRAAVTYTLVVEGIMADTGGYVLRRVLAQSRTLPRMRQALLLLARDESRHIAFGVYLLSRLIREHGNAAYKAFLQRMQELKPLVEASTDAFVRLVGVGAGAGGCALSREHLMRYSQQRFTGRVQQILRARGQPAAAWAWQPAADGPPAALGARAASPK